MAIFTWAVIGGRKGAKLEFVLPGLAEAIAVPDGRTDGDSGLAEGALLHRPKPLLPRTARTTRVARPAATHEGATAGILGMTIERRVAIPAPSPDSRMDLAA